MNNKELLLLTANGDELAFARLFDLYANHIYTIAIRFTGSPITAEETVQEVFLKIWLKRESLPEIKDFRAYLFIITRNYLYRILRANADKYRKQREYSRSYALTQNDTENKVLEKEYGLVLQQAIDRLPRQQKKVYRLVKEMGLKREDAAHLLQIHPETIKYHLSEAMKNLRRHCLPYLEIFLIILSYFSRI
jgi:RNA polymerase sigma-70 factor (ECF subfamily)